MAVPVWPAALPQTPLLRGFEWNPQSNEDVFQPSIGPPIIGPAMADAGDILNAVFILSDSQKDAFFTFWKVTTKAGSIAWTMPDWVGAEATVLVTKVPGQNPKMIPIGAQSSGLTWELSIAIYRRPYI